MRPTSSSVCFCAFLLILSPVVTSAIALNTILDVASVAKDVVIYIAKGWNLIDSQVNYSEYSDIPIPFLEKTEKKLFARINMINTKLNEMSEKVDAVGE